MGGQQEGGPVLDVLDASAARRWALAACAAMGTAAAEIDALNVYPVPDGDTGTNLYVTLRSAVDALTEQATPGELGPTLDILARGALLGARGNSGVILSQLLRGFADSLARAPADGVAVAIALRRATDLAYAAVAEPVEGTILTVARAAADAALTTAVASDRPRLQEVTQAAAEAARAALQQTPSQLAVLARAGVVDAGGKGLCVLLDALLATVNGRVGQLAEPHSVEKESVDSIPGPVVAAPSGINEGRRAVAHAGPTTFRYEVQFLLDEADEASVDRLRGELAPLGDSLVIVGSGAGSALPELWNIHVHVDDVGAAVEAGVRAGRPHSIKVTRFADEGNGPAPECLERPPGTAEPTASWSGRGLVAVAPGPGLAGLFAGEGAEVVDGDASLVPSIAEVLAAIRRTGAAQVVVLPNHPSVTAVADGAAAQARLTGQDVAVVPTKSPVQGLAAIAVADPTRRFADVVIALAEAAAATRWAEITVATSESMTTAGRCAAGDVLGLSEGDVVLIGEDQVTVACDLLDRLLSAGGELVTLVLGADAVAGFLDRVRGHLRRTHPAVDVMDYRGDQPDQPVLIGVE